MAPARPRPDGRLPPGRRHRGEAGHGHRRRDVEGDPRRPLRGRGADRHPAAPPRPLARRRPPGSSAQGLAHHVHPLLDRRRHRHPPRPARLPRAQEGEADRPDPDGAREHARTRARKRHERIIAAAPGRANTAKKHERIHRPLGRPGLVAVPSRSQRSGDAAICARPSAGRAAPSRRTAGRCRRSGPAPRRPCPASRRRPRGPGRSRRRR